jgi:hypothetical protein
MAQTRTRREIQKNPTKRRRRDDHHQLFPRRDRIHQPSKREKREGARALVNYK